MPAKIKLKSDKLSQPKAHKFSNADLLRLAEKHKPSQAWYDEGTDPFKPKPKSKR